MLAIFLSPAALADGATSHALDQPVLDTPALNNPALDNPILDDSSSDHVASARSAPLAVDIFQSPNTPMGTHIQYLADPNGQLTLDDATHAKAWRNYPNPIINFGYTDTVYWFRFALKNTGRYRESRLLSIGYPLIDKIEIWDKALLLEPLQGGHHNLDTTALPPSIDTLPWPQLSSTKPKQFGDHLPFSEREIQHRYFLKPFMLGAQETKMVMMRVDSTSSMQLPIVIYSERGLLEIDQGSKLGQGIYFGVMFAMMIYNLFLFFSLRDNNYLFYVASVISIGLVQATLRGYSYQWLWPNSPTIQHYHMPIIVSLSGAFVAFFSIAFLDLKKRSMPYYYICTAMAWVMTLNAVLSPLIGYLPAVRIGVAFTMLYAIVGLSAGVYIWAKGFKPAAFFTVAYSALFAGTLVIALNKFGLVPRNFFTENAQEIGSMLEVLLLSFALAYKITILRNEKEIAQRMMAERLEVKVNERTQALNSAISNLSKANKMLSQQSREDGLTKVLNRRSFNETFMYEWTYAQRAGIPIGLLMVDIDHFKRFNDTFGHSAGDQCLRVVAETMKKSIGRGADNVFRFGGEEFAVLLPGTPIEGAAVVAERIRDRIAHTALEFDGQSVQVTVSVGVSSWVPENILEYEDMMTEADKRLYLAKDAGRNCVVAGDNQRLG